RAFPRPATVEYPDALAISVIDMDLDGRAEFSALGYLRPIFLHLVWVGRGIGVGTLRVKPLTCHPRQRTGGSRDHHCRSKCMAHGRPPLSISPRIASEHSQPQRTAEKAPHSIALSTGCRNESGMVRPSCFAVSRDSLAQTVSPFGERAHSVKALTCRNIKCLLVGAGECGVGGLARDLDGPKILTLGIKHLDACDRGDVDAIIAVDRYPVCATLRARGNVAKLREGALVLD